MPSLQLDALAVDEHELAGDDHPVEVNIVWAPGYSAEVQVFDARNVTVQGRATPHVVTILVRSPYPGDGATRAG